jgi:hypothetical protein
VPRKEVEMEGLYSVNISYWLLVRRCSKIVKKSNYRLGQALRVPGG